jgi:glycosyltransferase involved in cell wall biosynthesis
LSIKRIVFNGKFLSGATKTGVHRVALELILGVDRLLEAEGSGDLEWVLMCPRNADPIPTLKRIDVQVAGRLTWQAWEQLELPRMTRGDLLVNLCNLAPLGKRRSIAMIHDAQTFRSPESYPKSFAAFYQFALPIIGRNAARILTVSEFSRGDLAKYGVATPGKVTVIHNGVDHVAAAEPDEGIVERFGLSDAGFVVAFASLQAYKNVGILFKAFARPEMAGLKLVFVGKGDRAEFEAAGYSVPPNVLFAGRVSDEELAALFGRAICLAFPSTTEGFGLPPLEAMAKGCPAVVAPCGAVPEVCGDAVVYAAPDDEAAWSGAVLQLAAEGPARAERVARGRAQAARFTWDQSARKLRTVIEEVRAELDAPAGAARAG